MPCGLVFSVKHLCYLICGKVADMRSLPIGKLLDAFGSLTSFHQSASLFPGPAMGLPTKDFLMICESANVFSTACNEMSLAVTYQFAEDLRREFDSVQVTNPNTVLIRDALTRMVDILNQISGCLRKESSLKVAMILPPDKVGFFESNEPLFGRNVAVKFPSITYEIDEAGKCLALNRFTASVFHCMRAMEKGLDAAFASIGLSQGKNPNWGLLLKEIKTEIDRRKSVHAWKTSNDETFFFEVYVSIDAVRNAWRNATMHIENKYTEEEATNIFNAVKGFMQKLSSRMDEQGQPLA